jgi:release factor glutamine methyltransferase
MITNKLRDRRPPTLRLRSGQALRLRSGQAADRRPRTAVARSGRSSISEVLRSAILTLAGADSPRLTAEVLLAHVLRVTRTQLLSRPERLVPQPRLAEYQTLVVRAAAGEPLAYLAGHREFYGLDFLVDSRVLIPRPETELLVDLALSHPHTHTPTHILDVGTGSGCIAVALAVHLPSAHITAIDISEAALTLARQNAQRHGVAERIDFVQSDLLSDFGLGTSDFGLLTANLPYIPSAELRRLPVSKHEPALALDGGPDGLAFIRRLLADAPRVLTPGGLMLLEIEARQGEAVVSLARAAFPNAQVELHQDLAGLYRVVEIRVHR